MLAWRIYLFFQRRRYLLAALVLLSLLVFGYLGTRIRLEGDITKFLPKDKKVDEVNFILQNLKIKDKLVINIYHRDSLADDPTDLMRCADRLADTLKQLSGAVIKDLTYKVSDEQFLQAYGTFYNNLPVFLTDEDYVQLRKSLQPEQVRATLLEDYKTLISPSGMVMGRFIRHDPLGLTGAALKEIQALQFDENFDINEGYIQTKDKKNLLMFVTPAMDPNDHRATGAFINLLDTIIGQLEAGQGNEVVIEYYGAHPVTLANTLQVRQDTITTLLVALAIIIFFLFLFFRRLAVIFYILLPVAFGALFSLTLLYLFKGEVSAIALGAGSIVLGIAINYSLHFFTHFKHGHSVQQVVKDLTLPMLIGCTTTVGAFLSLQFTKSQALHDFGLFTGFSLIGAVLFSIIVLPHLLKRPSAKTDDTSPPLKFLDRLLSYQPDRNKFIVLLAFIVTLLFAFTAGKVGLESDMMKMNYQTPALNKAQNHLDRINKYALSSIYVISKGRTLNEALKVNERVSSKLEKLEREGVVAKFATVGSVLVSDSLQRLRIAKWQAFWTGSRKDSLKAWLIREGKAYKFKENAFAGFYDLLQKDFEPLPQATTDSLKRLTVQDWIIEGKGLTTIVSFVKTEARFKQRLYDAFKGQPEVLVFDRQYLTTQFIGIISSDFNLVLIITAALVFGFMLLSHGRIELAVINFLPMFISWIWILGIMGLLGLKFNIINIIISTFIFGLGDDYSIFIMDGLASEYKYGRKNLTSYKTSIFLSALTNIVGVGVLVFARHPALRSVALITIIGMTTVLLISFIVQPLFYNFLILDRRKRNRVPYTAINLVITYLGFFAFVIGSILLSLIGLLLFKLIPLKRRNKRYLFHCCLMRVCRVMLRMFPNVRKTVVNPTQEDFSRPAVIICNHQSHIDLALILALYPKIVVFTNDWVWNSPFYGFIVKLADFYPVSRGYENAIEKVRPLVDEGYSILIFPEGTRSETGEMSRFHKGAFYLAEAMQLDILPVLIHGTGDCLQKGDFYFKEGRLTTSILPRITPQDRRFGEGYQFRAKKIKQHMLSEYQQLKATCETVDYFRPLLIKNYIYKGPVLEWYCRVKTAMEHNYRLFDSVLPRQGNIVDLGCGYGFLSLMLSFTGRDRRIKAIDYDSEKIDIANNCVARTEALDFECADVRDYELQPSDAFVINDVLHYLEPSEQTDLLTRCIAMLKTNGVLIIRDGDTDKKNRHKGTHLTELFSTHSGFNKTNGKRLHFVTASSIRALLDTYDFLDYETLDNTKMTSNITFIVRHKGRSAG